MKPRKNVNNSSKRKVRKVVKRGCGILDKLIDNLPVEIHLPSYQYCGPGTKLAQRLARGDKGVNKLDALCKEHDIAYENHKDSSERYIADKKLGSEAFKRVYSKDAKLGERAASLLVSAAMKAKTGLTKMGRGVSKLNCRKRPKRKEFATLVEDAKHGIRQAKRGIRQKSKWVDSAIKAALRSAKKSAKGNRIYNVPRIIKVPTPMVKTGGILPLLPILAGLSAIGAIAGSTAGVVKTVKDIRNAKEQLEENKRHNRAMELKVGKGLYLRPHSTGNGLYLRPAPKNGH